MWTSSFEGLVRSGCIALGSVVELDAEKDTSETLKALAGGRIGPNKDSVNTNSYVLENGFHISLVCFLGCEVI